jgi:hypothetical protein
MHFCQNTIRYYTCKIGRLSEEIQVASKIVMTYLIADNTVSSWQVNLSMNNLYLCNCWRSSSVTLTVLCYSLFDYYLWLIVLMVGYTVNFLATSDVYAHKGKH